MKKFFLIFFSFFFSSAFSQKQVALIKNSKSDFSIVTRADPTDIEKKAAEVFQDIIFKVSQCKLPITTQEKTTTVHQVIIGRTSKLAANDLKDLGEDGVLIKNVNNTIFITGGSRRGTLYAVYTFLEEFIDCQAFSSKEIYLPRKNSILLSSNLYLKQLPAFGYRMAFFPEARSFDFCDWRKMNYFYEDWGLWVHSFEALLPQAEYFSSHPEYYALINGRRNPVQLDPSNSTVVKIVAENLRKKIAERPGPKYWSVSQNDGQEYCHCPACNKINATEESPQGALLSFVNAVARYFPDKIIPTLAYGYSEKPPKKLLPSSNVMIMLTTATIPDRVRPINVQNSAFVQNFKKWSRITDHLFIWDYVVQFEHSILPFPNLTALQPNVRFFVSPNTKYMFLQGSGDVVGEFSELKCYLAGKLMWNPNIDFTSTVNRFLQSFYGQKGGTYVRQYIDLLQKEAVLSKVPVYTSGSNTLILNSYLSLDNIQKYKNIFLKAFKEVDEKSIYGKRLSKEYVSLLYAELENNKLAMTARRQSGNSEKSKLSALLNDWYQRSKTTNIEYLSEGRTKVDDYYRAYSDQITNQ